MSAHRSGSARRAIALRPPTLLARGGQPHATSLEQVAAEFALLTQRRARAARQIDLLHRQLNAALAGQDVVERRLALLATRMATMGPALLTCAAPVAVVQPPPPPPPPAPQQYFAPATPRVARLVISRRRQP